MMGKACIQKVKTKNTKDYFKKGEYHGIGLEYNKNRNKQRKMIFENGKDCYCILYDENNNEIYKGLLKERRPKEGNNIKIYDNYLSNIYIGIFNNFEYNGKILFYEIKYGKKESNEIHFKGIFNNDLYENVILYDPQGNIIYEGVFMKDIIKKIKIYNLKDIENMKEIIIKVNIQDFLIGD